MSSVTVPVHIYCQIKQVRIHHFTSQCICMFSLTLVQQDEVVYTAVLLGAYKVVEPLFSYACYLITFSNVIKSTIWKTSGVHFIFDNWMAAIGTNHIRILSSTSSSAMLELRKILWSNCMKIRRTFIPVVFFF